MEEPELGDYARWLPPDVDGAGHAFTAVNRGKRSIGIDLKAPGGRDVVLRLATRADVLVESFRPGVMDRLGLGDATLANANPRLVRASLVGYGPGPLRDEAGHDLNYEAMAGILAIQGPPDRPTESAVPIADLAGAMYAATAILAALLERERTGKGARVEVALADAALGFHALALERARSGEPLPARGAWELGGGHAGYRVYACGDGRFLALGALEGKFWQRLCEALDRPDLESRHLDPTAVPELATLFRARDRDAWLKLLVGAGVPVTPVLEPAEALAHPQHARFEGAPGPGSPLTGAPSRGRPPGLGEHTDAILQEAGISAQETARLRASGTVR